MTALLDVEELRVLVPGPSGGIPVVDGVSFDVQPGQAVGIAGESGSGKTMTCLALLGLLPAGAVTRGTAHLRGRDVLSLSERAMRRVRGREVGMVFQDPMTSLHPMLSIGAQLTEHMRRHLGIGRRAALARAEELLARVAIPNPAAAVKAYPHQFSGGMRQRIAIAIALASGPKLLIADEPTTALDVTVQAGILRLVRELCEQSQLGVIFVTHDLGVMAAVTDRLCVFYAGRIVEVGPTREVLLRPQHPYTRGLIEALPQPSESGGRGGFTAIQGVPPEPASRPSGCAFHPRCPDAVDDCRSVDPALDTIGPDRAIACPVARDRGVGARR